MAITKRSPVLGYNHNVRYRGLVFHVQTEDSGAATPHIFTHLFHGGVIISTRKSVYDAAATEEAVKSLMQVQHKAKLKELKAGLYDDKIDQYLGDAPGLLPRGAGDEIGIPDSGTFPAVVDDAAQPAVPVVAGSPPLAPYSGNLGGPAASPRATTAPVVVARAGTGETLAAAAATAKHAAVRPTTTEDPPRSVTGAFRAAASAQNAGPPPAGPQTANGHATGYAVHRTSATGLTPPPTNPAAPVGGAALRTVPPIPTIKPAGTPGAPTATGKTTAPRIGPSGDDRNAAPRQGVIVTAPAHVVVGGPRPASAPAHAAATAPTIIAPRNQTAPASAATKPSSPPSREQTIADSPADQGFGKELISEKSLDEVILAYLTDEQT